jgi:hypothetical protein
MAQITLNAAGGMNSAVLETVDAGGRYLFWFYSDVANAGLIQLSELSPLSMPIPFYSEVAGSAPVAFDLAVASGGRMEFTAATGQLHLFLSNGTAANAGNVIEYGFTRIAR